MADGDSDPRPGDRALQRSSRFRLTAIVVAVFLVLALAVPWVEGRMSPDVQTSGQTLQLDSDVAVSPGGGWTVLAAQEGVELGRSGVRVFVRNGRFDGSADELADALRSQVQDDMGLDMSDDSTEVTTSAGLKGRRVALSGSGSAGSGYTFVGEPQDRGGLPGTAPAVAVIAWGPKAKFEAARSDIDAIVDSVELSSGGDPR